MKPLRCLLGWLLAGAAPLSAQTLLSTEYELKDGEIFDTAAHSNATSGPANKRIWLAQGRVRAALDLQLANRAAGEDRYFDGVQPLALPIAPGATSGWEMVLEVELDEANSKLYTLTDKTLYREDVTNPAAPQFEFKLDMTGLASTGGFETLRVWSATQTVVVLTHTKVVTIASSPTGLTQLGVTQQTLPFVDSLLPSDPSSITPSQVSLLDSMVLAQDTDGRVLAYVLGQAGGYGFARPGPRVLVLCDLGAAGGFQNPTFDAHPSPMLESFVYFDPMRLAPPGASTNDWGGRDVAVLQESDASGLHQNVFVACGRLAQVQRLDATAAWTNGLTQLVPQLDVDPQSGSYPGNDIQKILVHPIDSGKLVAIALGGNMWWVDRVTGQRNSSGVEIFTGIQADVAAVVRTANQPTVWAAPIGNTDRQIKVIDVTRPLTSGATLPLVLERFWQHRSDGGVAIPEWNSIYVLTFGGVIRYEKIGNDWQPDLNSLQPAAGPYGAEQPVATEHILLARDVFGTGKHRLYVADGTGSFLEFKLNPTTKNPEPPTYFAAPPLSSISPGWVDGEPRYGNDVAFVRINGEPWVLTDLALLRTPASEAALLAWRWTGSEWKCVAKGVFATATGGALFANTDVISVTSDTLPTAFVNYPRGFASIPLATLANPTPTLAFASNIDTYQGGAGFRLCKAIATRRNRVFVCLSNGAAGAPVQAQINMYSYTATTGVVGALMQSLTDRDIYCQSNGAILPANLTPPPPCTVTGTAVGTLGRSFRARYHATSSTCGALYVCYEPFLLELAYNTTADALVYSGHWSGDYELPVQDCNRYDFGQGPRLLVVKDSESFALVAPTTLTCP